MFALAATIPITTKTAVDEDALERLKRDYLPMWAILAYGSAVGKGAPGEVPYVDLMKASCSNGAEDGEDADHWVCNLVEAGIEEIQLRIPFARAALSVRYVRGATAPGVYRSGRTGQPISLDDIADQAELALIPACRRRGLPL